jgi:isocitrate/isopropylmalate dehydrogenase
MMAIESVTAQGGVLSRDLGGTATTKDVTEAICNAVRGT